MARLPRKYFRDAIGGRELDARLEPFEIAVLHTGPVQRLRFVRQLGFADVVYPGATHTRFEHSIGVLRVTSKLLSVLRRPRPEFGELGLPRKELTWELRCAIRLAALLHDVGHLPFGHTLENELAVISTCHDSWDRMQPLLDRIYDEALATAEEELGIRTEEQGELWKQFQRAMGILAVLCKHEPAMQVLAGKGSDSDLGYTPLQPHERFAADIVGNTISADLLDYVRRDVHAAGLVMDYDDRLLDYAVLANADENVVPDDDCGLRLAFCCWRRTRARPDVLSEIVRILRMRYFLAERVYYHHAKCVASAMLARAIGILVDSGSLGVSELEQQWLNLGDEGALRWLTERASRNQAAKRLVSNVLRRRLYKIVFALSHGRHAVTAVKGYFHRQRSRPWNTDKDPAVSFCRQCEETLNLPPGSVVLHCPPLDMSLKYANVMIVPDPAAQMCVPLRGRHDVPGEPPPVPLATSQEVRALEENYSKLWRLIVAVAPEALENQEAISNWFSSKLAQVTGRYAEDLVTDRELATARERRPLEEYVTEVEQCVADLLEHITEQTLDPAVARASGTSRRSAREVVRDAAQEWVEANRRTGGREDEQDDATGGGPQPHLPYDDAPE